MSSAKKFLPNYCVDEHRQWEGDWELIDGIPISMSPSPAYQHQQLASKIFASFVSQLDREGCRSCEVLYELDWIVNSNTVIRPDIVVTCNQAIETYLEHAPKLVVEVLSPATAERDRTVKFELYQQHGVRHYILADPQSKTLEAFESIGGLYQPSNSGLYFRLHTDCQVSLDRELFH